MRTYYVEGRRENAPSSYVERIISDLHKREDAERAAIAAVGRGYASVTIGSEESKEDKE